MEISHLNYRFFLELEEVHPKSEKWSLFLEMSVDYLLENWPTCFKGKSRFSLMQDYDQRLRERIRESARFLFLFKREKETVGFANIYLTTRWIPKTTRTVSTLHIVEFSILPRLRRQHLGSYFLNVLVDFGKKRGIEMVWADVDLNNEIAMHFWKRYFSHSMQSDTRVSFWRDLS